VCVCVCLCVCVQPTFVSEGFAAFHAHHLLLWCSIVEHLHAHTHIACRTLTHMSCVQRTHTHTHTCRVSHCRSWHHVCVSHLHRRHRALRWHDSDATHSTTSATKNFLLNSVISKGKQKKGTRPSRRCDPKKKGACAAAAAAPPPSVHAVRLIIERRLYNLNLYNVGISPSKIFLCARIHVSTYDEMHCFHEARFSFFSILRWKCRIDLHAHHFIND
jgi:hypothetical protein